MYVDILKERYEGKVTAIWEIGEAIKHNKMLKLSLQPIIENAVYHGLCPLDKGGSIFIRGKKEEGNIVITISDNGIGMTEEQVDRMSETMNNITKFENEHIGIKNVHQRIRLMFGEKYGISIESKQGNGTRITISMPIIE
jgi:two-component system sensor histidine kinase YesM